MSMSSGHRTLLGEVLSWAFFAGVCVVSVTHFAEITALAHRLLGTEAERLAAATAGPDAPHDPSLSGPAGAGGNAVELTMGPDGHYHAVAEINGRDVAVMVDTGASVVALTYEDADEAGIFVTDKDFTHRTQTANGVARVAPVMLDSVSIGDITVRNVRGVVSERGALGVTLLGMSFLNKLGRVDMRAGTLVLEE